MRTSNYIVAIAIAFSACLAEAAETGVAEATWPANVGQARVMLPVPAGYAEATRSAPHLRQFIERLTPPTNRLLACFVDEAEVGRLRPDPSSGLSRYFLVQTLRQTESTEISPADFNEARTVIREQYKRALLQAKEAMQKQVDATVRDLRSTTATQLTDLRLGEIRGLEVFIDEANAIGMLAISKVAVQAQGRTVETPIAMAMNTALVGGKLIYFYAYSTHSSDADLEWVEAQSRAWLKLAAALNQ